MPPRLPRLFCLSRRLPRLSFLIPQAYRSDPAEFPRFGPPALRVNYTTESLHRSMNQPGDAGEPAAGLDLLGERGDVAFHGPVAIQKRRHLPHGVVDAAGSLASPVRATAQGHPLSRG